MPHQKLSLCVCLVLTLCGTARLHATPITFVGTNGSLSAEVIFAQFGSQLNVTLTNTSLGDVLAPAQVLTAVFFSLDGNPTLNRLAATLAPGSDVLFGGTAPGGVVGGEWAYKNALSGTPGGAAAGISSVGLGLFGPLDRFPGPNLQGPESPNGLQYGITAAGDNPVTGNTPVTGTNALLRHAVMFTLGLPVGYSLNDVHRVSFQYGTSLSEPNVPGNPVPEPATFVLLGSGLIVLCVWKRKQLRSLTRQ
jgi:PEP-CTERM motif-containing protein